jgi:hypothetical protein
MATGIFSLLGIKNSKDGGSSGPSATLPNKSKFTDRDTSDFGFMDRNKFNTEIMSYPQGVEDDPSQGHYMLFFIKSRRDAEVGFDVKTEQRHRALRAVKQVLLRVLIQRVQIEKIYYQVREEVLKVFR